MLAEPLPAGMTGTIDPQMGREEDVSKIDKATRWSKNSGCGAVVSGSGELALERNMLSKAATFKRIDLFVRRTLSDVRRTLSVVRTTSFKLHRVSVNLTCFYMILQTFCVLYFAVVVAFEQKDLTVLMVFVM